MKTILLIIPYFGKWPLWFDAFLVSVAKNPSVHWFCPTDCDLPQQYSKNISFFKTTLQELNIKVNSIVEAHVPLTPRKFCDLKPAYGDIFKKEVKDYDFWGICDMDIIWGDIRAFISNDILDNYDIISSRNQAISGHFTLFKNNDVVNGLYSRLPNYKQLFEHKKFQWTDEVVLTEFIKFNIGFKSLNLKVYWDTILCNAENGRDSHQEYYLDRWQWQNGKILNTKKNQEVMYLHFINWKRLMKYNEVKYLKPLPEQFFMSYTGIHFEKHNFLQYCLNALKNIFNGYYVREYRRIKKQKMKSLVKRIKRKIIKHFKNID